MVVVVVVVVVVMVVVVAAAVVVMMVVMMMVVVMVRLGASSSWPASPAIWPPSWPSYHLRTTPCRCC